MILNYPIAAELNVLDNQDSVNICFGIKNDSLYGSILKSGKIRN